MRYRNASDVLPEELVREVQKYVAGATLYFPKDSQRKKWGEESGSRRFFQQRNDEIRRKYTQKVSLDRLADEYCLAVETVRKIVFK